MAEISLGDQMPERDHLVVGPLGGAVDGQGAGNRDVIADRDVTELAPTVEREYRVIRSGVDLAPRLGGRWPLGL